jgi:SAM-dependent methyltransferase
VGVRVARNSDFHHLVHRVLDPQQIPGRCGHRRFPGMMRGKMGILEFSTTKIGDFFIRIMASLMESRFRYRFFRPQHIVDGAEIQSGQTALELGCGTGFFTPMIAGRLGEQGTLIAMDILPQSVEAVSKKIQSSNVNNVRVVQGNALNTKLDDESLDAVLLFGVIPAPMLPLDRLLPEVHRILKPGGVLCVWPASWMRHSIAKSDSFTFANKRNGVLNFKRS